MERLNKWDVCREAMRWIQVNNIQSLEEAWKRCERGDWMLWLYVRIHPDHIREIILAAGHCANTVRHLMKDSRSTKAVDAAIAFGEGLISHDELKKTMDAAYAAAAAAYAAAGAAYAAAYAAYAAAYADTDTAADTAAAAYAAAAGAAYADTDTAAADTDTAAAYADTAAYAKKKNQLETANICRQYLQPNF